MPTASPAFKINSHAATSTATVSAGASVTATLDSIAGVDTVAWSVTGTDGSVDASSYTLTPSGSKGETVQFTAGAAGTAGILTCRINGGVFNGQTESTYTATAKWAVLTNGYEVGAVGEFLEADSVYGSTKLLNAAIRAAAGGGSGASTDWKNSVKCIAPANLADLSNVATSQDGYTIVAGDRVGLVFQTSLPQNGIYAAGTPSGGFVALTRAVDFDEAADVTDGATFVVERGSLWAGTTWQLRVGTAITFGSTNLTFALVPGITSTAQGAGSAVSGKVPTTGEVRIGYNGGIYTRDSGSANNYRLIGNDAIDGIVIGDTVAAQTVHNVKTSGYHAFQVNSTEVGRFVTGALQFGTNPAAAGVLRFANNVVVANARNAANSADLEILRTDGSNNLYVGFGSASPTLFLGASTAIGFTPGGSLTHSITTTTFTWDTGTTSVTYKQADKTANGGTGALTTIQAQNETGTTSTGGGLTLTSGTGTTAAGNLLLQTGGTTRLSISPTLGQFSLNAVEFDGQSSSAVNSQAFSATPTFDFNTGNNQVMAAATANITSVTLSNPRSGAIYTIMCTQDGTGGRTIAWPAATRFNGTDATFGATANNVTVWTFLYDGSVFRCLSSKVYAT